MGLTRAELREYVRFRLSEHGAQYLPSTSSMFDLNEALADGWRRYAIRTLAYPVSYSRNAVPDMHSYHYASFGVILEDDDAISTAAAANNTTPFAIAAQPPALSRITVTLYSSGDITGVSANYTITGYGRGMKPITDVVSFTNTELTFGAGGGSVTKTSDQYFQQVVSIVPSAAQNAGMMHKAGVPAQAPGKRVFAIRHVSYDDCRLERKSVEYLERYQPDWRVADSGTPELWIPWGSQQIRVWRAPDSNGELMIDGWEIPDTSQMADDNDEPDVAEEDAYLIALWACILATTKAVNEQNQFRASVFYQEWESGIRAAFIRMNGGISDDIVFGEFAGMNVESWPVDSTIINIT